MDAPLFRISHSKVRCFQQCRKKYWFRYVSGEEWPQQTPNVQAWWGQASTAR